jgi:glycosyltransferase involved in cell wall biosynthesis
MTRGTLVKIVGAHDMGGVRSCEFAFTQQLRQRGVRIFGVILGEGATAVQYRGRFDESVEVECPLRAFGAGKVARTSAVLRNELVSPRLTRQIVSAIGSRLTRQQVIGVAVRRPYYVKVSGLLARELHSRVFWHMCDSVNDSLGRAYYRSLLRRYDVTPIGNSRYTIASLLGAGTDGAYVYPGYWPERVRVDAAATGYRADLGIPATTGVFAVVARLSEEKATDLVLEAFVQSEAFRDGAHLVIAGGPSNTPFARRIRERVEASGNGRVHLLGEINDVNRLYAAIDVLVNGRRKAEPFGISIVEALAAGRPVIAYRRGGPQETIADGATGWLVDEPTVNAYREAFDRAWRVRARWGEMGTEARAAAPAFSTERQVDAYLRIVAGPSAASAS